MRLVCLSLSLVGALAAAGCAPRFRSELVARATLPERPGSPLETSLPVAEASVTHVLSYQLALPRAVELKWKMTCPAGFERTGVAGETFANYRVRRLAELERQRRQKASLVGGLVGAVAPKVQGEGTVHNENGSAHVEGEVDPGKAAEGAVLAGTDAPQLPAADVGAQLVSGKIDYIVVTEPGACAFVLWSELPEQDVSGVRLDVTFEKLIDVRAENAAKAEALRLESAARAQTFRVDFTARLEGRGAVRRSAQQQYQAQIDLRARLNASLVARGADPTKRARERAAAEAERQRQLEIRWRRDEERRRAQAQRDYDRERARRERWQVEYEIGRRGLSLRGQLLVRLQGHGADPTLRRRQHEEELRRWQADMAYRAEQQRAADEQARLDAEASLSIRAGVKLRLNDLGAVDRPPRPADVIEAPPEAPFAGAVWIGGGHAWNGSAWVWVAGHYERPPERNVVWVAPIRIHIGGSVAVKPGRWVKVKTRDHRRK